MNKKRQDWIWGLMIIFIACKQPMPEQTIENATPIKTYSTSFRPAQFEVDRRKEFILELAPKIHALMEEYARSKNIPGIAYGIVTEDQLVFDGATGYLDLDRQIPASTQAAYRIASMSKSFTAMAIVKLRDEGKLSLEDPVRKYIPEMSSLEYLTGDAAAIDINNLLTMTAGFPEDNPWGDRQLDQPDTMLINLLKRGISFSNIPSYQFEYSNTGYAILGQIISRISGIPYQDYIRQNLLLPLGMEDSHWEFDSIPEMKLALGYRWEDERWQPEPMLHDGSFGAMGGLITTIRDFSKYVQFHLSAWPPRSQADNGPVARNSVREMHQPQFTRLFTNASDWKGEPCATMGGYGFGLGISTNCHGIKRVSHGGALPGFGSNFVFYPEYGVGLMAFCNLTYTSPWPIDDIEKLLFDSTGLKPRSLPVSDILTQRQDQIMQIMERWDPELENRILAENFYLDKSREKRMKEIKEILVQAGTIETIGKMKPHNQLRGNFEIQAENGIIHVYFTLTPESDPKIQQLHIHFEKSADK